MGASDGAGAAASGAGAACERASVIDAWSSRIGKKGERYMGMGRRADAERTIALAYTCARESSRQKKNKRQKRLHKEG